MKVVEDADVVEVVEGTEDTNLGMFVVAELVVVMTRREDRRSLVKMAEMKRIRREEEDVAGVVADTEEDLAAVEDSVEDSAADIEEVPAGSADLPVEPDSVVDAVDSVVAVVGVVPGLVETKVVRAVPKPCAVCR